MVKKIEKINKDNDKNKNEVERITKFSITVNSENFLKKVVEIPIFTNFEIGTIGGIGG